MSSLKVPFRLMTEPSLGFTSIFFRQERKQFTTLPCIFFFFFKGLSNLKIHGLSSASLHPYPSSLYDINMKDL